MKRAIEFFANNPVFSELLTVFIIGVGLICAILIKREAFPPISFDIVTVTTTWPGASADDVERLLTNPIEIELKEITGIKKLQSVSAENISIVNVILDPDQTTEAKGKDDVQTAIDQIVDLPKDAEEPKVNTLDSSQVPVIEVTIDSKNLNDLELREKAKALKKELETLSGVAKVVERGVRDLEVRIEISPEKLAKYRLSLQEVSGALAGQNVSVPGGVIEALGANAQEKFVRTLGEFQNLEDIQNTVIRSNDFGRPIRIKDVAEVYYALERAEVINHTNANRALSLTILKHEKADIITLVDSVRSHVESLKGSELLKDINFAFINDISEYVRRRLGVLTGNMLIGLILILLFLPALVPFRFALVIAMGLPMAFLGTIFIVYNTDVSVNLLSMMGFIIVSGILVDDAIVTTENAARLVEEGYSPKEAAIKGTLEIAPALTASVMTTAFAFFPMLFMSGIMGKFIKFIPMAILIALAVSLFEAFFILPTHVSHWIPADYKNRKKGLIDRIYGPFRNAWEQKLTPLYMKTLDWVLNKRYMILCLTFLFFIGSIFVASKAMKFVLFPADGIEIFFVKTEAPTGISLKNHEAQLKKIEDEIMALPKGEVKDFITSIGLVQQDPNDPATKRGSEYAQITVYLTPEMQRNRTAGQIIEGLREKVGTPDGFTRVSFERVRPGPPVGKPISIGVRASEYDIILSAVKDLKQILKNIDGVEDITDSYILGKEEVQVLPDTVEALAAGVTTQDIGMAVRASYGGHIATKMRKLDEEIDLRVSWPEGYRSNAQAIEQTLVPNPTGHLIPLKQIANIKTTRNISTHNHEANSRQVLVSAEIDEKKISSIQANSIVKEKLPELLKKHPKVKMNFGGEDEDTQESMMSLARAFGVAVLLIFLMLVLTFKSLTQPFLVLLTIPLGIIAIIWTFFLHNMPLSFMGMLGIVALAGVIVNNAIILMDFYNQKRNEGLQPRESILNSARQRIRPILMTSVTTVAGILPTAYGLGGDDPFVIPIAMALGWGVLLGAIMSCYVFPCALLTLEDIQGRFKKI